MNRQSVLLLQKEYIEILKDLKNIKISLPTKGVYEPQFDYNFDNNTRKLNVLDDKLSSYRIVPNKKYLDTREIFAYDESIVKYKCLEGSGYQTAHSLIYLSEKDFVPIGLLTFYFYTASKNISESASFIKHSNDIDLESKKDYMNDRINFLLENVPPNSLLLIDGPLIAGDVYTYMIRAIDKFLDNDIIPVFFVKNSSSNMIIDNMSDIKNKYNSDMHWSYEFLKKGDRSSFFKYVDLKNSYNSKVFCYLKAFDKSPQRIEFHLPTYLKHFSEIDDIVSLIYYFLLAQGDKNPQIRPIAIAEKYAREFIKISNIDNYFPKLGFIPTMNQERFG